MVWRRKVGEKVKAQWMSKNDKFIACLIRLAPWEGSKEGAGV